jgi:hypothetical protein
MVRMDTLKKEPNKDDVSESQPDLVGPSSEISLTLASRNLFEVIVFFVKYYI